MGYHFQAILNRSRKCQLRLKIFKLARMPPFPSADDKRVETPSEFFYFKKNHVKPKLLRQLGTGVSGDYSEIFLWMTEVFWADALYVSINSYCDSVVTFTGQIDRYWMRNIFFKNFWYFFSLFVLTSFDLRLISLLFLIEPLTKMPSKMEAPESAKTITVFVNGDSNYNGKEGFEIIWNNWKKIGYNSVFYELLKSQVLSNLNKKFVVNRKRTPTFDTLLGDVTSGVKAPFGAVRNLYTPVGGTRISSKFILFSKI